MGQRVAIIDIDLHHGNGTEEILMAGALRRFNQPCSEAGAPSRVAFLSVHQYDEAQFPQTGAVSPCKEEPPFIINEPIPFGLGPESRHVWRAALTRGLEVLAKGFRPTLVVVSAGFDAHKWDPINRAGGTWEKEKRREGRREEPTLCVVRRVLCSRCSRCVVLWCCSFAYCFTQCSSTHKGTLVLSFFLSPSSSGNIQLDDGDFKWAVKKMNSMLTTAEGRIVGVLEGGYGTEDP